MGEAVLKVKRNDSRATAKEFKTSQNCDSPQKVACALDMGTCGGYSFELLLRPETAESTLIFENCIAVDERQIEHSKKESESFEELDLSY